MQICDIHLTAVSRHCHTHMHRFLLTLTLVLTTASNSMVCNDEDIYTIAGCEFDWRHVGQRLLRGQKLRDIDNDGGSEREKREKMLLEWRRTKSHEATYQALVKVLQTVENNATAIRVEDFKSQGKICNFIFMCNFIKMNSAYRLKQQCLTQQMCGINLNS